MIARCAVLAGWYALCAGLATPFASQALAQQGESRSGTAWNAEIAPNSTSGMVLDARQSEIVKQVSDYFNAADKLQGRFVQTSADGKVMKGKFAMMRPGRFRFDYARPSLQVIISDGRFLAIQDHDLNNEDRVELDQTPFRLLLRSDVDVARDARILAVEDAGDAVSVMLQDKSPDTPGRIRLTFTTKPEFQLKQWTTKDAQGLDTVVEVGDLDRKSDLDPAQFVIKPMGAAFNR
ncbi:MAG: outer membrane lipoprotein carrier protein LolA [Hyphomicrobiaceae bacterium]